jgi:hypothetical protein
VPAGVGQSAGAVQVTVKLATGHAAVRFAGPQIVVGSIGSLKLAEIIWLTGTSVAPSAGSVESNKGGLESALANRPVLKVHTKSLARAVFAMFLATVVIVAV